MYVKTPKSITLRVYVARHHFYGTTRDIPYTKKGGVSCSFELDDYSL